MTQSRFHNRDPNAQSSYHLPSGRLSLQYKLATQFPLTQGRRLIQSREAETYEQKQVPDYLPSAKLLRRLSKDRRTLVPQEKCETVHLPSVSKHISGMTPHSALLLDVWTKEVTTSEGSDQPVTIRLPHPSFLRPPAGYTELADDDEDMDGDDVQQVDSMSTPLPSITVTPTKPSTRVPWPAFTKQALSPSRWRQDEMTADVIDAYLTQRLIKLEKRTATSVPKLPSLRSLINQSTQPQNQQKGRKD